MTTMLATDGNRMTRTAATGLNESRLGPTSKEGSSGTKRKGQRTLRACDFCRLKKAKCDGQKPCKKCQSCKTSCTYSHLRKSSRPQSVLAYAATLARQQATLIECVEILHRRLRVGHGPGPRGFEPKDADPNVNDIILSLGLDPINTVEFDSEDNTNHSKSQSSPSASGSSPTTIEASPIQDTLELQESLEFMQTSSLLPESSLQNNAQSIQPLDRRDTSWKSGSQYSETLLPEDDMFSIPSFPGDVPPGALNPWTSAATYDTASYPGSYDLFHNPLGWNG